MQTLEWLVPVHLCPPEDPPQFAYKLGIRVMMQLNSLLQKVTERLTECGNSEEHCEVSLSQTERRCGGKRCRDAIRWIRKDEIRKPSYFSLPFSALTLFLAT